MKQEKSGGILHYAGKNFLFPFILVTSCFALWGFANDITNPMVKAFSKIFRMSVTDGTLVQVAFYGGYFCMAFPAAAFIRKYSYKAGIMLGLALYATGASSLTLFSPAACRSLRRRAIRTSLPWVRPRRPRVVSTWRRRSIPLVRCAECLWR